MTNRRLSILTAQIGLAAAVLVGIGEFLLHFDAQARYASGFEFFEGVTRDRATIGHFLGVLGAPLYVVGAFHLYLMLRPAHEGAARVAGVVMAYGCIIGAVWIGSRASAAELVAAGGAAEQLALYELRYENLLQIVRAAVLIVSGIFVWLCLTGRTHYPRTMALLNPISLILVSFLIFFALPAVGKYIMPIALNVAYFVLFAVSLWIASRPQGKD